MIGLITIGQACAQTENSISPNQNMTTILTSAEMQKIIEDSITWLDNAQLSNGRFNYEYAPFWDRYTDDDNIVRQTGALYILGEILKRDKNNKYSENIKKMMQKSIGYLETHSTDGKYNDKTFKCILKSDTKCGLGAASLALIGIVDLVQKYPELEKDYSELMTDYLDYIMAMKMEGKGYMDGYSTLGYQSETESTFSNGEAFLALVRYNQYKPSKEMKKMIDDSFIYFADIYTKDADNNFYLWGMAAIKDLYAADPRDEYFTFVKKYTDERIRPYKMKRQSGHNVAAYMEGIINAYSILKDRITETEKTAYLEEINFWLTKTSELQIKATTKFSTKYEDENDSYILKIKNAKRAVGGFLTGTDEPYQRIDFTQHSVSSYLQKLVDIDGTTL